MTYRIRACFDWKGGGPTSRGSVIKNGSEDTEGIKIQGLSTGFEVDCDSTISDGGECEESTSSFDSARKTLRFAPDTSSIPSKSTHSLSSVKVLR